MLWLGQVVSELGDWFYMVALMTLFPTRGEGAALVAGLFVSRFVFATLMMPIAGVIADRYPRGGVMIATDLARAVLVTGFLFVRGVAPDPSGRGPDVVSIFVLSLLLEGLSAVFEPARGAAIPQVVPEPKLFAANALGSATWSAMLGVGALLGGYTASFLGRRAAFAVDAASFVASALFVAAARVPARADLESERRHPLREAREGLAWLRAHPAQRSLLVLKPGALLTGGFFVLITVFADQVFTGDNAVTMGLLFGARGVGALAMPFVLHRFFGGDVRGVARTISFCFPLAILCFAAFSRAPTVPLAGAALCFAYGGTATVWVGSTQLLQVTVPNRVLGRVLSAELGFVTITVALAGTAVGACLRQGASPRVVALGLAASLAIPFVAWMHAKRKHLTALREAGAVKPQR